MLARRPKFLSELFSNEQSTSVLQGGCIVAWEAAAQTLFTADSAQSH